ncbi:hypothetical protein HN682_07605 [Candidatus Peregrinibacteria bacterium]|nr:hypothetical protein [Candidatus Peregrinibacteria bacterium]
MKIRRSIVSYMMSEVELIDTKKEQKKEDGKAPVTRYQAALSYDPKATKKRGGVVTGAGTPSNI